MLHSVMIRPGSLSIANLKQFLYLLRFRPLMIFQALRFLLTPRNRPAGLEYHGGETWWAMRVRSAAAILNYLEGHPSVIEYFRYVDIPEEILFASLLKTLPETRDSVKNTSLRLICWDDVDSSSPQLFTMKHKDMLLAARKQEDLLFARKFDQTADSGILDWLDAECGGAVRSSES